MLHILRNIGNEQGSNITEFLSETISLKEIHGLIVEFDRDYLSWWFHHVYFGKIYPRYRGDYDYYNSHNDFQDFLFFNSIEPEHFLDYPYIDEYFYRFRNKMKPEYPEYQMPIIFRVLLRLSTNLKEYKEKTLPRYHNGFRIVYEKAPPIEAFSSIDASLASSVGNNTGTSGTIGGFLQDKLNHKFYLMSCAHVLGVSNDETFIPSPQVNSNYRKVGKVVHSILPEPNKNKGHCSQRHSSYVGSLDLALTEIDDSIALGNLPNWVKPTRFSHVSQIPNKYPVEYWGNRRKFMIGRKERKKIMAETFNSHTVYAEMRVSGETRCFGDVFCITRPEPYYTNNNFIKGGDSGAWLLRNIGQGGMIVWDGMIFGGHGARGYACYSENIMKELETVFPNLELIT